MRVGIDIIKVERIKPIAERLDSANRVFTKEELEYIQSKKSILSEVNELHISPLEKTMAGIYSAKEAVLKALGIGVNNGIGFLDVEILHDNNGAPIAKLSNMLKKNAKLTQKYEISINISHDGDYATAICIIS